MLYFFSIGRERIFIKIANTGKIEGDAHHQKYLRENGRTDRSNNKYMIANKHVCKIKNHFIFL
jgi:hypothetical protein